MNKPELLQYMRTHALAVQSSVSASGMPQSAVIAFYVSDDFHIVFDATANTRKIVNLRQNPRFSLVVGGMVDGDQRTVQYEGIADEPQGEELETLKELYFGTFPDGRDRLSWPGLVYVRVKPVWIRCSDFNQSPPEIVEFEF